MTTPVELEIKQGAEPSPWTQVEVGSQTYSYRYTGGRGNGKIENTVGSGTDVTPLSLHNDARPRFQIKNCEFVADPGGQLSWSGSANAGAITDKNTKKMSAYYCVMVRDTQANLDIPCDPPVINR